jgi:hypothetical protein
MNRRSASDFSQCPPSDGAFPTVHIRDSSGSSGLGLYHGSTASISDSRLNEIESSDEETEEVEHTSKGTKDPGGSTLDMTTRNTVPIARNMASDPSIQVIDTHLEDNHVVSSIHQSQSFMHNVHPMTSHAQQERIPIPRLEVEDTEDGYIFERPTRTRVRTDSDEEESQERPSKRVRMQSPDEVSSYPSSSPRRVNIKHSGGRRTRGFTRRR